MEVEEVINFLLNRWGVLYEFKLVVKGKSLYLQIMWGFLEQQSFPLSEAEYRENLSNTLEIINRLDYISEVRQWLINLEGKPRVGRALSLPLRGGKFLEEFVL